MVDKNPGGARSREDRLTYRAGLGVLARLVHHHLIDQVVADAGDTGRRRRLLPLERERMLTGSSARTNWSGRS